MYGRREALLPVKLLVVNPNTNPTFTEAIRRAAVAAAAAGTEIEAATAPFGFPVLKSPKESARAGEAVLEVLAAQADKIDGAVIAAFSDPGLAAAKKRFPFPIAGIAEASMLEAASRADRFAIVTLQKAMDQRYRAMAEGYGVGRKLVAIRYVSVSAADLAGQTQALVDAILDGCRKAVAEDGAGAIIVGGGPLAGIAERVARALPVPVLDGVPCAVRRIERLVAERGRT